MRKIIIIVIASFILNNCGYTPLYSSKENNFYIKEISQKNISKLNSKISNKLIVFSYSIQAPWSVAAKGLNKSNK